MKHTRHGFTMIELIFVIVIIGILAGVALPRFTGVSEDAHVSKIKAFVGTLNRTVAPSMWSSILNVAPKAHGSIKDTTNTPKQHLQIFSETATQGISDDIKQYAQVEVIPSEFNQDGIADNQVLPLAGCADVNNFDASEQGILGNTGITRLKIGASEYTLVCRDGDLTTPPHFYLHDGTNIIAR